MLIILRTLAIVIGAIVLALFVPGGIFMVAALIKKNYKKVKDMVTRFRMAINY